MRLVTYEREGQCRLGALVGQRVVDLSRAYVASRVAAGEPAAVAATVAQHGAVNHAAPGTHRLGTSAAWLPAPRLQQRRGRMTEPGRPGRGDPLPCPHVPQREGAGGRVALRLTLSRRHSLVVCPATARGRAGRPARGDGSPQTC